MGFQIQRPDISAAIQRLLRLTGSIKLELEDFIIPTIVVADLSPGSLPPLSLHAVASFTVSAVALERAIWRWEIPGSAIARLTRLIVRPAAQRNLKIHFGASLSSGAFPSLATATSYTDGRVLFGVGDGNVPTPAAVVVFGTQVALVASEFTQEMVPSPNNVPIEPKNWLVGTGDPDQFGFIEFQMDAINEAISITMEWDEWRFA